MQGGSDGPKKFHFTKDMVNTLLRQVLADTPEEKSTEGWQHVVNNLKTNRNFENISLRTARDRALAEIKKWKTKDRENQAK